MVIIINSFFWMFTFFQVGAADYIAIARTYHTVFISDIPVMSMRIRDKVLMFHASFQSFLFGG